MADFDPTQSSQPTQDPPPPDSQPQTQTQEDDIDASIEADIAMPTTTTTHPTGLHLDGSADPDPALSSSDPHPIPTASDPRVPTKKDASLRDFLNKMDDYAPIIPDAVTNYYLTLAGLPPPPQTSPHLSRLLALATQKFIADIAADAYQYSRIRSSNTTSNNPMGSLGAAAGLQSGGQQQAGAGGQVGGGGGGAGAGVVKEEKGKGGANLGVQRPGFGGGGQGGGQGRTVLTMEDLGMAVGEYGVNVKRGEFYR